MSNEKVGYICPNCRILFSARSDMNGNGVLCPSCHSLLSIPLPSDGVIPLGLSKLSFRQSGVIQKEAIIGNSEKEAEWLETRRAGDSSKVEELFPLFRVFLILSSMVIVSAGVYFFVFGKDDDAVIRTNVGQDVVDEVEEEIRFDHQNLASQNKLREFLDKVYAASSVDELLVYCRKTEGLKEKMLKHYGGQEVAPRSIRRMRESLPHVKNASVIIYNLETSDYEVESGYLSYDDKGFLLDWESYTAYSEMSLMEMSQSKPTKSVELRVSVSQAEYYNLDFKDDTKWQSVKIESPNDSDISLFGYVKKNSATDQKLSNFGVATSLGEVIIKAHFPENSQSDNQVIITEVVSDHWFKD